MQNISVFILQDSVEAINDVKMAIDGFAGFTYSVGLEQFTDLEKYHYHNAFRIFSYKKSAYGGEGHKEVLIKHLAVFDAEQGFPDNVPAGNIVSGKEEC